MSNAFHDFTTQCGIERQHTVRARPQQNGVTERANRVLYERLTTMLDESGLPKAFWGECLAALVHVWNRYPTEAVRSATPYELWHGRKPDVSHLRVFQVFHHYLTAPIQRTVSLLSSQSVALIFCTVKQVYSTLSSQSVAQKAPRAPWQDEAA
jgi:hypothetical protein